MNQTIKNQLNHRTIRFFKDKAVPTDLLSQFLEVMNRTASSTGFQSYSVIRLTDQKLKDGLAEICQQKYVAKAPELFVFIVDLYRIAQIAKAKGYEGNHYRTMNYFFKGTSDAILAAQNTVNAIESAQLGAVFLGSILNKPATTVELLQLPELTFPILGLAFGYPDDDPELKPRMEISLKVGENGYPYQEDYLETLKTYDEEMSHYYDTRKRNQRSDTYTNQIRTQLENPQYERARILQVIEQQGFQLGV